MTKIQWLESIPTGYSDKLTAEHFILWNKLKKQLKEDKSLNPEEKTIIADKLADILWKYESLIWNEEKKLKQYSDWIKEDIYKAIDIEELKSRNYKGYTENDKKVMSELEENYPEKYENLILNHAIEFTEDHIIIYYAWKWQYDRKDLKTKILWYDKMTKKKALEIANNEWKIIDYRFHDIAEEFWNDFVVNLFELKDWDYHTGYANSVQESKKIGSNVSVKSCDPFSTAWTSDTKKVDSNYEAHVRLCKDLSEKRKWWWISMIID